MNYALTTRFAGPTDASGSRIIASYDGKHKTVSYSHNLNDSENHEQAAARAALFFGLGSGELFSARLKGSTMVHILVKGGIK